MAKKKTQQYKDRKYNYPKGFTKYGKAKTGFMPAAQGARTFVTNNFEKIKSGSIPFDSLTQREKRVYRGKNNPTFENLYTYQGKSYYDPTRTLRKILDNDITNPELKGKRDLTNFLSPENFKDIFNQRYNPTKYADGSNSSFYDFIKDSKKEFYRDQSGTLLDVVTRLNKVKRSGRNIRVIESYYFNEKTKQLEPMPAPADYEGKINVTLKEFTGTEAIEAMRNFESRKLLDVINATKEGQQIQLQIVYLSTDYNPFTNTVTYNLNEVQVNNLKDTP
jgi:hypothetical protein